MFYEAPPAILLLYCLSLGVLGIFARTASIKDFRNGLSLLSQIPISLFLTVVFFLVIDVALPESVGQKITAITKMLASLLGAGFFYDESVAILRGIYMKYVVNKLALDAPEPMPKTKQNEPSKPDTESQ